jgi:hypothetical protein
VVLHAHEESASHNEQWHYRAIIGKLNYHPDIMYAVHQCTRFCENPKVEHTMAVKRIGRYLLGSMDRGVTCSPDTSSLVCYTDASFLGEWPKERAEHDPITACSRTGCLMMFANCPIVWSSNFQTEITHSATKAEYVALSQLLSHSPNVTDGQIETSKFHTKQPDTKGPLYSVQIQCQSNQNGTIAKDEAKDKTSECEVSSFL